MVATLVRRRPGRHDRPAIRLRPVPVADPPFDDELGTPTWAGPGVEQLALDLGTGGRATRTRATRARQGAPAGVSAESTQAVRRFVRLCLEILNGFRPAGHLRPLSAPGQGTLVVEQLGVVRERVSAQRQPGPRGRPPVALRQLLLCEPRDGAVEATVLLVSDDRTLALALRLERHRTRWLCTAATAVVPARRLPHRTP